MECPYCRRAVEPAGQLDVDGDTLLVYQCPACVRPWEFDGQRFDAALTFAVDSGGRFFDPDSLAPLELN